MLLKFGGRKIQRKQVHGMQRHCLRHSFSQNDTRRDRFAREMAGIKEFIFAKGVLAESVLAIDLEEFVHESKRSCLRQEIEYSPALGGIGHAMFSCDPPLEKSKRTPPHVRPEPTTTRLR